MYLVCTQRYCYDLVINVVIALQLKFFTDDQSRFLRYVLVKINVEFSHKSKTEFNANCLGSSSLINLLQTNFAQRLIKMNAENIVDINQKIFLQMNAENTHSKRFALQLGLCWPQNICIVWKSAIPLVVYWNSGGLHSGTPSDHHLFPVTVKTCFMIGV